MAASDRRERATIARSTKPRKQPIEQSFRFWLLSKQLLAQHIFFKRPRSCTHYQTSPLLICLSFTFFESTQTSTLYTRSLNWSDTILAAHLLEDSKR